jgi:hypothetical protein
MQNFVIFASHTCRTDDDTLLSEKMEIQAKEQQEAIDFGNYMKEKNPKTLERWRRKHQE